MMISTTTAKLLSSRLNFQFLEKKNFQIALAEEAKKVIKIPKKVKIPKNVIKKVIKIKDKK